MLVDDTPGAVVISGFDPVRREIAREAMLRLIQDGRIHPTRIEEAVAKVREEMEETIVRLGEEAVAQGRPAADASGNCETAGQAAFPPQLFAEHPGPFGRSGAFDGIDGSRTRVGRRCAKRAGLLHDIGKAVNHEIEGPARGGRARN